MGGDEKLMIKFRPLLQAQCQVNMYQIVLAYHTEGNFGGGKIWRIKQNITVGELKFGELLAKRMLYLIN